MSIREFTKTPWRGAKTVDENTPLTIKLGGLGVVAMAAFTIGGWVRDTNDTGKRNSEAIAALGPKIDTLVADMREVKYALGVKERYAMTASKISSP